MGSTSSASSEARPALHLLDTRKKPLHPLQKACMSDNLEVLHVTLHQGQSHMPGSKQLLPQERIHLHVLGSYPTPTAMLYLCCLCRILITRSESLAAFARHQNGSAVACTSLLLMPGISCTSAGNFSCLSHHQERMVDTTMQLVYIVKPFSAASKPPHTKSRSNPRFGRKGPIAYESMAGTMTWE